MAQRKGRRLIEASPSLTAQRLNITTPPLVQLAPNQNPVSLEVRIATENPRDVELEILQEEQEVEEIAGLENEIQEGESAEKTTDAAQTARVIMTVLRSREVRSTLTSKTLQPIDMESVVVEPMTPAKNLEFLNQTSNCSTPSASSSADDSGQPKIGLGSGGGSTTVLECGTVRRRSARLATKVGISEYSENIEVVTRKRKKVEGSSCNGEFDVRRTSEIRVLDFKLGLEKSSVVPNTSAVARLSHNLGDGGVTELVMDSEEVKDGGSLANSGLRNDRENLGLETVNNGKGKRKFSMEMKSLDLESCGKDIVEKEFLNLRSGKRVVKREMNDDKGHAGNLLEESENSKESCTVLSGDVLVKSRSAASMEKDENGGWKERRLTRGEKGKGKVGSGDVLLSGSVSVNFELDDSVGLSLGDSKPDAIKLPKSVDSKVVVQDKGTITIEDGTKTRGRLSKEEKGKMKLVENNSSFNGVNAAELQRENINGNNVSGTIHSAENAVLRDEVQVRETDENADDARRVSRDRFRNIARRIASRFAHFSSQEEQGNNGPDGAGREIPHPEVDNVIEDWPGPFSTAMKIIKDRENKTGGRHVISAKSEAVELKWIPKKQDPCKSQKQLAPSLQELCLSILAKNADAITSLECVPDVLRHKISWFLCDNRRMDAHFLELLLHGTPTEIRVRDCSWLSEEQFTKTFEGCNTSKLMVLQFDQCGCCMPDYALSATLARFPNCLPALTTISLKGAYRLTDAGLHMLVSSATSLKSIDISQCPLLTSEGICSLTNSLQSVLRELYLDNSHGIDAMLILPALLKLENLEVLSLAGIQTVTDDFVSEVVSVHGCRMKELILADCMELTDSSLEVIGHTCLGLRAIDLTNLCKLTDVSIGHLANGCHAIQMIRLCRNVFSDEAVAAYLDVRGACLKDLSLNNIIQVSNHTALSLARNCKNLQNLDLSWCRNLTNEALGLIVDSCSSLQLVKLFGCTQVTNVFIEGHSNEQVKLIGLKMTPVFKHIDVPDFLLGPLRYSSVSP
ncbi:hypothetical protein BUALT_Bualt16G0045100 [Buddleja alternifolia]|uniref:Rad7 n=1 Tax=Buddleja alternifolia TaxID=168488 RepID=A0AAV6WAL8_9LAMI|nr:hypothetical protein BUALT_Bualt16G0045100 [Buddleja alternifolia]